MTTYTFDGAFQTLNQGLEGLAGAVRQRRDTEALLRAFDARSSEPPASAPPARNAGTAASPPQPDPGLLRTLLASPQTRALGLRLWLRTRTPGSGVTP